MLLMLLKSAFVTQSEYIFIPKFFVVLMLILLFQTLPTGEGNSTT